jgi:hypothetical protein
MSLARVYVLFLLALGLGACSSSPRPPEAWGTVNEGQARIYSHDAAFVLRVADASLRAMHYTTYDGNKNMIVGSRSIATPALPFTQIAGAATFPVLLAADAAVSPFSSGPPLALASVPLANSGYEVREVNVRAVPSKSGTSRVTIWGHPEQDVAQVRAAVEKVLGASRPTGPDDPDPGPWQRDRG